MNVGKIKVIFDRSRGYAQAINTLMLLYLFLKSAGFSYWYLLVIPLAVGLIIIDTKKIIGQERDFLWSRPSNTKDMVDNIKAIRKMMENNEMPKT